MRSVVAARDRELLDRACSGDPTAFEHLVATYRGELRAHCYRMLGSLQDSEDALQDAMLAAWQGLSGFEGRGSLRSWLYRLVTRVCLKAAEKRRSRVLPADYGPAAVTVHDLGKPATESAWMEPYPQHLLEEVVDEPGARYERSESVELAFIAALQHLPATQRAILLLRDVLGFSAAEVASLLDTTTTSVNSAMQRARTTLHRRVGSTSQQATLRALGEEGRRELVNAFVAAWERADVTSLIELLVQDARFTMPPFPLWLDGRAAIEGFVSERMFETPWRLVPAPRASGQLAFACYQQRGVEPTWRLSAVNVLTLRGRHITEMTGFLDPAVHARIELAPSI